MASSTLKAESYCENRNSIEKGQVREELGVFCKSMKDLFVSSFPKGCRCDDYFQVNEQAFYHFMSDSKVSFDRLIGVIETVNKDNYPHLYQALADAVYDINDNSYGVLETVLSLIQYDIDRVEQCFADIVSIIEKRTSNELIYCLLVGGVDQVFSKNVELQEAAYNVAIAHLDDKIVVDYAIPEPNQRKFKTPEQYFNSYLKSQQDVSYDTQDCKVALSVYFSFIFALSMFLASQWDYISLPFNY